MLRSGLIWILLLLSTVGRPVWAVEEGLSDYALGSGDLISIQVFGETELSVQLRLSDAGSISYPFLGEIRVKGLTTGQLARRIDDGLRGDYLVDPNVNVTVLEYRQFFIYGQVEDPGGYPFQPGLSLQKAVALAGGFTERASSSKFYVLSESDPKGEQRTIRLSDTVKPGDVITIDESFF